MDAAIAGDSAEDKPLDLEIFEQRFERLQHLVAIAVVMRFQNVHIGAARARLRLLFFFFLRFHFKSINNAVIIRRGKNPKRASKSAQSPERQTNVAQISG